MSALFPITSRPPGQDTSAIAVPILEARRTGLSLPAWVIVDEWNEDDLTVSPFLADPKPLGSFSPAFCIALREAAVAALKAGTFRRVAR